LTKSEVNIYVNAPQQGSSQSFEEVWSIIASKPLDTLPHNTTSFDKLSSKNENTILIDAKRTLESRADILEPFDKLAHPNGICFKGLWHIDTDTIYSGYFKKESRALIIARASTALSNTTSEGKRAFGFAGKLFATTDPQEELTMPSANFFLVDDLGGTDAKNYTDVILKNEPEFSFNFDIIKNLFYAVKLTRAFAQADSHAGIRQLYEISELSELKTTKILTPKWMKLEAQTKNSKDKKKAKDFRNELKLQEGETLIFNIYVANKEIDKAKNWQKIGTITLDTSVVSNTCDHQLHFHHPKWRDDLEYGE
jgi:hypothetical protein